MKQIQISSINEHRLASMLRASQASEKVRDPIQEVITSALPANCTILVQTPQMEWTGSGFHIGNGLIVTASHVVPLSLQNQAYKVYVTFDAQSYCDAVIKVSEPQFDVGILACNEAKSVPYVSLADSNLAEPGDTIAVIASPEGWHDTVTVGRISNTHQSLSNPSDQAWNDMIFIDADILEGASGGMVIGTDGLVYGLVMGVTGKLAQIGIGQRAVCPSNKIRSLAVKSRLV